MKNIETVTSRIEKGEGTVGRLLSDDTIASNVEEITEDAGGFIKSITRLQTIVGLRTEYNFLSSTFKNYLSIQLMPRPDKFYLIELVEDPRGYREQDRHGRRQQLDSPARSRTPRSRLTEQLRFTLAVRQAGRDTAPVDRRPLRHQGVDGRRRRRSPPLPRSAVAVGRRVRRQGQPFPAHQGDAAVRDLASGTCSWSRGADDMVNSPERAAGGGALFDWFAGLQLVFNDEDLRRCCCSAAARPRRAASK